MRWPLRIGIALVLVWALFSLSPFLAVSRLLEAVATRDAETIRERVNLRAVRISLTKQIMNTYLDSLGQDQGLARADRQVVIGAAIAASDPLVRDLLTPEALAELLGDGWPEKVAGPQPPAFQGLAWRGLDWQGVSGFWNLWLASESRGFRAVRIPLDPSRPADESFQLHLRLQQFTWRLTGVDLPLALRQRLVERLPRSAP